LVLCKTYFIIISLKCNLFSSWYSCKITHLGLNNNHSLTIGSFRSHCRFITTPVKKIITELIEILCNVVEERNSGYSVLRHFQQYFSYVVVVSFIGGGNRSTLRKPDRPAASYWERNKCVYIIIKYIVPVFISTGHLCTVINKLFEWLPNNFCWNWVDNKNRKQKIPHWQSVETVPKSNRNS
jgi:hypothetical protein